jgi:hypothetical protein
MRKRSQNDFELHDACMKGRTMPRQNDSAKSAKPLDALILTLRNQKVILDADLAEVYGVRTKALNQAVKRNRNRFPEDFMFQLDAEEKAEVVTACDHLGRLRFSPQLPYAFTEHGALQAANLLRSERAVAMSVYVIRAFVQMREQIAATAAIQKRLGEIDRKLLDHDEALVILWNQLKPLLAPAPPSLTKRRIGFHP